LIDGLAIEELTIEPISSRCPGDEPDALDGCFVI
jgi:hypothetical protein